MKYERLKYPDGGVYARITDFSNPTIAERINTYEDLFFVKSLKDICDYNGVKANLFIPCMFQQQHDRRFKKNESFELRNICDFINSCKFEKVTVFHPHSDCTEMGLNNVEVLGSRDLIENVLAHLKSVGEDPILMSCDAGGYKSVMKLADQIDFKGEVYSATKSRDPITHKLTQCVDRKDFGGKAIVLIDDLCVFGGTFVGLAKMLKERNAGNLFLAISHMTVQNPNKELENLFEMIWTTNSKYESYDLKNLAVYNLFHDINNLIK